MTPIDIPFERVSMPDARMGRRGLPLFLPFLMAPPPSFAIKLVVTSLSFVATAAQKRPILAAC